MKKQIDILIVSQQIDIQHLLLMKVAEIDTITEIAINTQLKNKKDLEMRTVKEKGKGREKDKDKDSENDRDKGKKNAKEKDNEKGKDRDREKKDNRDNKDKKVIGKEQTDSQIITQVQYTHDN